MRAPASPLRRRFPCVLVLLLPGLLAACSTRAALRRDDAQVRRIQRSGHERALGDRVATVRQPRELDAQELEERVVREHRELDLERALALAVEGNREYRTELERLYTTALSLSGVRHQFSPRLSSVLSHLFADGRDIASSGVSSASVGLSQVLPTGGTLSIDAQSTRSTLEGNPDAYSTGAHVRLVQPLLRGAGYEVSHASLIQAERDLIYATRNFELFRENFSIDVARRYYGLVRSKQQLRNQEENLERAIFDRRKAEALFDVGRDSEVTVLRAKRQELNSRNALLSAQERLELDLEDFAIFLGLPEGTTIDVSEEPPDYVPVRYSMESAVDVALANRLDLMNETERLEDARRSVRIAEDLVGADLSLDLSTGVSGSGVDRYDGQHFTEDVTGSLTLSLPLDRKLERNALRRARIDLDRAQREYEQFRQNVALGVRSAIRELERRQLSVQITEELIAGEAKNKRIAELQFERGEIDNRELVDAEQSLLDARNDLISEQVAYEIARLGLLRDMGILFIDDRGMWKE